MLDALLANELSFRNSAWLWGLLLPFAVALLQKLIKRQQKQNYADSHLWPWVAAEQGVSHSQLTRPGSLLFILQNKLSALLSASRFLALAWLCLIVAIAGPRSQDMTFDVQQRAGIDVMIDIDVSQSMKAQDVMPSRFQFAKTLSESLVANLAKDDRVALSVFAGQPHSVMPLTHDKNLFQQALNIVKPGLLPTKGSWLELALIGDLNLLTQTGRSGKVLVVFTDGAPVFWKPIDLPKAVQELAVAKSQKFSDTGVKVIYVGVGLPRPTTIPDANHRSGHLYASGLKVLTRLEEPQLKQLAQQTEGVYLRAEPGPDFMRKLLTEIELTAASLGEQRTMRQVWHDYAQPFMVAGLLSLLFAFYLWKTSLAVGQKISALQRLTAKSTVKANRGSTTSSIVVLALSLSSASLLGLWSGEVHAQPSKQNLMQQAYQAFDSQSYELAESLYEQSTSYAGWFGAGAAAYRQGNIESAVLYFRQAAWHAPDDKARAQALYNLGNSYYLANLLPQAIESFEQALLYQSPYENAEHNLALAKQRRELEQQGKQRNQDQQGEGEGKGSQGKDSEGAFYGGQKVGDSDSKEQGFGSDGDADDGDRHGEKMQIPESDELTDYRLNPSIAKLRLNSEQQNGTANSVLLKQRSQQRAEKFEHQLQQLNDDQHSLLKRMFEREEGFHAVQEQAHEIPGVQPW